MSVRTTGAAQLEGDLQAVVEKYLFSLYNEFISNLSHIMDHYTGQLTAADGANLFVQTWDGETYPQGILLLVHGLGEHSGRYQNYVDYFVPRGYTVVAYDTRGHGRSGGRRGYVDRFQQYVDDIAFMVSHIRSAHGNLKPFVLGHSLGSLMALSYGLQHPNEIMGIIVTGTAMRDALELPGWKRSLAGVLSYLTPAMQFKSGLPLAYLSHDPVVVAAYEHDPLIQFSGTPRLLTEVEATRTRLLVQAASWSIPLLMSHGGDDRICPLEGAQMFYAKIPTGRAEIRVYDGLYHEIHNEPDKVKVFGDIERWLDAQIQVYRLGN
jgi:alpha-beta hydrolase superfamily lysophospholipase